MKPIQVIAILAALFVFTLLCVWFMQTSVCKEMQRIMQTSGTYSMWVGCTLQVGEVGSIDDLATKEGE